MTLDSFKSYCIDKKGVEETYPFGDQAVWFKLGGKAFAWTFIKPFTYGTEISEPFKFINLKCDPDKASALRATFEAVKEGWHQNKKYWNSVFMDGSLSDSQITAMIDHSYEMVMSGLSKKLQALIKNE